MSDQNPDQLINEKLYAFGLNDTEIKIYLFLLSRDPQTILEISRGLSLPRTSIYDNSTKLIEKGLVERIVKHKSQRLRAHPIEILQHTIDQHKAKADDLEKNLQYLQKHLSRSLVQSASTQVRYYEGKQGFRQMMWNALSARRETVGYSVFGRVAVVGPQFYQRWVDEFKIRNLTDRVITTQLPETLHFIKHDVKPDSHQLLLENIKYIPSRYFYVAGDTTIYNDTFAVSYWQEGETVGIEIQNPELVKTQKTIFELLWMQARPIIELLEQDNV